MLGLWISRVVGTALASHSEGVLVSIAWISEAEVLREPPKGFVKTLLSKSREKANWKLACLEWSWAGWIEADPLYGEVGPPSRNQLEFTSNCELCGARLTVLNCVIQNETSGETLRVGRECVKRFPAMKNVASGEVGGYVDRYLAHEAQILTVRRLANGFLTPTIDRLAFVEFVKAARSLVGEIHTSVEWETKGPLLLEWAEVAPGGWLADRIRLAFLNPMSLPITKATERSRVESEERLRLELRWGKRRTGRVEHVGSGRSEEYKANRLDPNVRDRR